MYINRLNHVYKTIHTTYTFKRCTDNGKLYIKCIFSILKHEPYNSNALKNLETTLSCVKDFLFTIKSDFIKEVTVQGKS